MLLFDEETMKGERLASLWDACFREAECMSLCTSVWTQATDDTLRRALEPYRLRSFHTARWFCHLSTEPFLEVNLYAANEETRRIIKEYVRDLFFDIPRNRDLFTLEDLCFFKDGRLFFGTVSHENVCAAQEITKEFAESVRNLGMWTNHYDPFAETELNEYGEGLK